MTLEQRTEGSDGGAVGTSGGKSVRAEGTVKAVGASVAGVSCARGSEGV